MKQARLSTTTTEIRPKTRFLAYASAPAAILLAGCTSVFFQPSKVFFFKPEDVGATYGVAEFPSLDGTKLTGFFFPARGAETKATIVHFHGNAENITTHFAFSYWLVDFGFNVFIFDYRGYGVSTGKPTQHGLVSDGIAALRYVRTRSDVDPGRLVILGQSLGAAIAVAAVGSGEGGGIRAIVLDSPFSSYRSIVRTKLASFWPTWPLTWPLSFLVSDRHRPMDYLNKLPAVPLLVIHSKKDIVVPYTEGLKLFSAAKEPKTLWAVTSNEHTAALIRLGAEYRPKLVTFLNEALGIKGL